ncbi:hypothetical protein K456DRAFT_532198 [Colletotrichum gloeosporioides 23]|nr:hypothetical protein K456DRAFT_532198 [Colletotrichum gloeosporioides 23]
MPTVRTQVFVGGQEQGGERKDRTGAPHRTAPPTQPPFLALSSSLTSIGSQSGLFVLSSFHVIVPVHAASLIFGCISMSRSRRPSLSTCFSDGMQLDLHSCVHLARLVTSASPSVWFLTLTLSTDTPSTCCCQERIGRSTCRR